MSHRYMVRSKKICGFPVKSPNKIRVGRSLLNFFIFYFIFFPDFTKKRNRCVVCTKYITKSFFWGLFT